MGVSSKPDVNVSMEEEFVLEDEDVAIEMMNGIPSITFLDHVHRFIERKITLFVVIKLLGMKIGFYTLLNKLSLL
ncbi:hypothetical protein PVK06_012167 [Gossypium arboreum]|uniref:Uncharacterized protein n=1 Tax=Gossypium arboreum TaxID=29729 RepID=A0ABR0QAM4_GOSAR|nr:hypothetical protein PVK06_012167 [Gossypium arboreum]